MDIEDEIAATYILIKIMGRWREKGKPQKEQIWRFFQKRKEKDHITICIFSLFQLVLHLLGPFLWMEFNCLKATEPLQGDSLLFTAQFPIFPSTHLIDFGRMKG